MTVDGTDDFVNTILGGKGVVEFFPSDGERDVIRMTADRVELQDDRGLGCGLLNAAARDGRSLAAIFEEGLVVVDVGGLEGHSAFIGGLTFFREDALGENAGFLRGAAVSFTEHSMIAGYSGREFDGFLIVATRQRGLAEVELGLGVIWFGSGIFFDHGLGFRELAWFENGASGCGFESRWLLGDGGSCGRGRRGRTHVGRRV